jgi:dTDP-glucose 4,6-dehydratase
MKKILLTGAGGFIGSHLAETLIRRGYDLKAFIHYNAFGSWGWLEELPKEILENIEVYPGDIRDPLQIQNAITGCDTVFHLAALIAIPYSYFAPESYVDTNIRGTLNILQAAKMAQCDRIIVTSTSEVYGTAQYVPIDEKHPRQGQSPYAATKIGADALAESFFRSYNLPLTIVRPFNTFGPRQSARAVIPSIITQLLEGYNEIKLGNLKPTRDFNYVKDVTEAFLMIANEKNTIGEEINVATQKEIGIGQMARKLISKINPDASLVEESERLRPDNSEVERLLGSNEKVQKLTGWKPNYSFDEALEETIEWFKIPRNISKYKTHLYNV